MGQRKINPLKTILTQLFFKYKKRKIVQNPQSGLSDEFILAVHSGAVSKLNTSKVYRI